LENIEIPSVIGDYSWSPDCSKIVFTSDREGNRDIYVMNANGTDERMLTDRVSNYASPSWSPDGSKIVFVDTYPNLLAIYVPNDIFIINADGTGMKNLTRDTNNNKFPVWLNGPYR